MSNHVFNEVSCSGIIGDVEKYKNWLLFVWEIEPETRIPMKHTFVNNLNELDEITKKLNEQNIEHIVILQDINHNYIPISYSNNDLKLAIETDDEYWDRIAIECAEETFAKEELKCANMW